MKVLLTTFPDPESARRIISTLVEQRLIACGTFLPAQSIYQWKGQVESAGEVLALLKTTERRLPAARRALENAHPYEVPEIVTLAPSGVNSHYARWLRESVTSPTGSPQSREARAPR